VAEVLFVILLAHCFVLQLVLPIASAILEKVKTVGHASEIPQSTKSQLRDQPIIRPTVHARGARRFHESVSTAATAELLLYPQHASDDPARFARALTVILEMQTDTAFRRAPG
jgi:hypothetical protein